jgi:uncharacterized BrkB/YihY/UPF0761 family membrane protein
MTSLATTLLASDSFNFIYWIFLFLIWILIMIWIYNIARRKGRHALGWLILGFFFSLITLIIVLLLPSKRTTQEYEQY